MAYIGSGISRFNTADELTVTGNAEFNGNATFGDNDKAVFGAGSDLQIFHDGSNSFIDDAGTGVLGIRSNNIALGKYTGENLASFVADGAVTLYYDNAAKFATTATGVDVTGVITTDGMTTSADINFGDADYAYFGASNDLKIGHTGSASVIQETGTGDLFLDATNFQIRSGDGSETLATLTTDGAVTLYHNNAAKLATTSTGVDVTGNIDFSGGILASNGSVQFVMDKDNNGGEVFVWGHNAANATTNELMRLDSSGNVLVGKTSEDATTVGSTMRSNGGIVSVRDGDTNVVLNRKTSDGTIIDLRKDGTTVGSIGSFAGNSYFAGSGCGLRPRTGDISPTNASGSTNDGGVDLGTSSNRFNNILLSGGVYLGGTGSANKLDDYEEGTWTPTVGGDGGDPTTTYNVQSGRYVKIGKLVYVWCRVTINTISGGSGSAVIRGLPFTSENVDAQRGNSAVMLDSLTTDARETTIQVDLNATSLTLLRDSGKTGSHAGLGINLLQSNTDVRFQYAYRAA